MRKNDYLYQKIQEIRDREQSLVLVLVRHPHVISIHFERGLISAACSNNPQYRLGKFLKESGAVDDARLTQLVDEARRQRMFIGQAAVKQGLVDVDELLELVQEQAIEILKLVFEDDYEVRSTGRQLLEFYVPARIDLDRLMLLIARKNVGAFQLGPGELVVLKNSTELTHLPWYPEELAVMGLLKTPRELKEIQSVTGLDDVRLRKILSVLDSLRLIEVADAPTETSMALVKRRGFPFEALVPQLSKRNIDRRLQSLADENSFFSEQFNNLKVQMAGISGERPMKVITITSPDAGAGKSLLGVNLAASFSKDPERKTIIVDCDLRKPSVHSYVGASMEPGLMGYLQDDRLQSFCFMRRLENLFVMTAGGRAISPVELLSMEKMRNLIQYLRTEFDTIILDAPPMAPISDAQVLAGLSDGIILVVRSGKTSYSSIERAVKVLDDSKLIGIALNDVPPIMFNTQQEHSFYGSGGRSRYPYGAAVPKSGVRIRNYLDN